MMHFLRRLVLYATLLAFVVWSRYGHNKDPMDTWLSIEAVYGRQR